MLNVGLPSANFVDCKSTYRPFVLFSKGVAPQDEWKTLRIVKPQCNTCLLEKRDPSYRSGRSSPYTDNREKEELSKPIKVTKKVITSITIDKPIGFIDNDITEKALAIIGQTNNEDTSYEADMSVNLSVDEVKENNKTEEKKL